MKKITTLAATVLIATSVFSSYTLAAATENSTPAPQQALITKKIIHKCHAQMHQWKVNKKRGLWNLGLKKSLKLTKPEAVTLTRAALIMKGFKKYQVGDIKPIMGNKTRVKAYIVEIKNQKNKVIKRVVVNANNGRIHPLKMKRHLKMHMKLMSQTRNTK